MEDIVDEKGIERVEPEPEPAPAPKPKKERSQAQKEAFEKARKKRAENLAKKKQQEAEQLHEEAQMNLENKIEHTAPKKKRGRPRKSKLVKDEPPAEQFIEPPQLNPRMNYYPVQGQQHYPYHGGFNPYYQPQPPPQQPVINNYYHYHTADNRVKFDEPHQPDLVPDEILPEVEVNIQKDKEVSFDEELVEEFYEPPPDPRLKFRIAG
tara:strand:+ start:2866 stop:3489 length:624 start_codon:yes stop_codon:yes gene_type:complete